ncbi:MAG: transcription-repair coupling factor, partial [Muribaculaceae bacterium]|nr:transcription-repair coupling factor [Muribaculaceae bacterium]
MSGMMTLGEAASLFATSARLKALRKLIDDRKASRISLTGLKGSSAAMLLGKLADVQQPMVIVADDADSAGYLYHDLSRVSECEVGFFPSGYKRHIKYGRIDAPQQILRAETLDGWRN